MAMSPDPVRGNTLSVSGGRSSAFSGNGLAVASMLNSPGMDWTRWRPESSGMTEKPLPRILSFFSARKMSSLLNS